MKTQPQRCGTCSSRSSPEFEAILDEPEFQAASVDTWNEAALRRRAALAEVETRADNLPTYQGSCSDPYERGDRLIAIADIELELARSMARRLSAAAYHKPGPRLDVVKGEWLTAHRRRPLQPRCRTFGCTLPDLHAGLHQVASPMCKRRAAPRRWAGEVDVLRQKKVIGSAKRAAGSAPTRASPLPGAACA
eukprot:CAMPEP_0118823608 /NCGR_PEP_ID=MMETSP1162-20130426/10028_1 /TAXON_ID=33656 /ORGANISM="Phaeocystis Sp, Strain CCMP2710" /LENGTH=191 /DNA_ID=CAMNT_0006754221 /DNA_START=81 /DNA_END=656 /DNA_ORIENTATION=+